MKPLAQIEHYKETLEEVYIHPESENSEVAKRFKHFFPEKIKDFKSLNTNSPKGLMSSKEFDKSKKRVLVQPHKGQFFKQCPGGNQNSACCNYFVLNLGSQCHFNCSYCYLQSFLNTPYLVVYSNIDQALDELTTIAQKDTSGSLRIGTGEVIDSLGLDSITNFSNVIMDHIIDFPNLKLELKTKSSFVDHLLNSKNKGNTTISWSINPEHIVKAEEHGTASASERLKAAKKSIEHGYKVGFHIDPVIWHPNWKENYSELIEQITSLFTPKDVPYLSLGALRFQPEQRHMMKERFERSSYVNQAELFESKDGKLRYDADLRSEMFKFIIDGFKEKNRAWRIFLCMESPETWLSTYGAYPKKVDGLEDLFSPRAH
jgi:spore photoproduct lyase